MQKIAIITDTNSGITPTEAKSLGVYLLKMPFFVDGEEFFEYGSLDYEEFFHRMTAGAAVSTSQPSPGALTEIWDRALKDNDYAIYLPMSSGLSGTYSTAKMLAEDYDGRVLVVDNKRISVTLRSAVLDAIALRDSGMEANKIAEELEQKALSASIYIAVNTLEHLKKSGRVTAAGAAIGTLLGIKPVLQIQGEKLDAYKKVRGMNAAAEAIFDGIENDIKTRFSGKNIKIAAAYSGIKSQSEGLLDSLKARFPDYDIKLFALPISISCHVGPGAFGVGVYETVK